MDILDQKVQISVRDYIRMLNNTNLYEALNNGGVDNWEWFEDSLNDFEEIETEEDIKKAVKGILVCEEKL